MAKPFGKVPTLELAFSASCAIVQSTTAPVFALLHRMLATPSPAKSLMPPTFQPAEGARPPSVATPVFLPLAISQMASAPACGVLNEYIGRSLAVEVALSDDRLPLGDRPDPRLPGFLSV